MWHLLLRAPVIPSNTLGLWTHAHFALGLFLARSVGHVHKRVTDHLNVVYYVADTFSEEYTGSSLKMVERNVEDDYIANLRNNCWKEKQQSKFVCVCACGGGGWGAQSLRAWKKKALLPRDLWAKRLALPCASHGPAKSHLPPLCFPGARSQGPPGDFFQLPINHCNQPVVWLP